MNPPFEKKIVSEPVELAAVEGAGDAELVEFVSFSAIVGFVRSNLIVFAASIVLCCLAALVVIKNSRHIYEATATLSASQSIAGLRGGPIKSTASILRNFTLSGGSVTGRFPMYREKLFSVEVAARVMADYEFEKVLFEDQWDAETRTWHPPKSLKARFKRFVRGALGLPEWLPPSELDLLRYMESKVEAIHDTESDILHLTYRNSDPKFALNFLTALVETADQIIREDEQEQTRDYIAYITGRLETTNNKDLRRALVDILVEQERKMMLSQSTLPFAAQTLDRPSVTNMPVSPSITRTLLIFAGIGVLLGFIAGLARSMYFRPEGATAGSA